MKQKEKRNGKRTHYTHDMFVKNKFFFQNDGFN